MNLRKKIRVIIVSAALIACMPWLAACGTTNTVNVSNLADEETLKEVAMTLKSAGLDETRVESWAKHVRQFAETAGMENLIKGYRKLSIDEKTYDEYKLQDAWSQAHPDFDGYNCRISAWELVGNFTTIKDVSETDNRSIMMDERSLEQDNSAVRTGELEKFKALYTTVQGANSTDVSVQKKLVMEELERRGISFEMPDGVSLVELYVHGSYSDDDNELFVGHAGVLVEQGAKGLLWVEKVGFQAPYRVVKLKDRPRLYDYLIKNYGVHSEESEAESFVLENGKEMIK